MPVERAKVKAALDTKYKGTSLTKELKEGYADAYAELIEDEAGIEAFLNTQDAIIRLGIKDADRRSQAAAAKARQEAADAAAGKTPEDTAQPQPEPTPDGMPDWFKPFANQFSGLTTAVSALQKDKTTQTIAQRLQSDERTKGIPTHFYSEWRMPESDADFDAFADKLKAGYEPFAQAAQAQTFSTAIPGGGVRTTTVGAAKEASKEQLDAVMANLPI